MKAPLIGVLALSLAVVAPAGVPSHVSAAGTAVPSRIAAIQPPSFGSRLAFPPALLPTQSPDYIIIAASKTCYSGPGTCTSNSGTFDDNRLYVSKTGSATIGTPDRISATCERYTALGTSSQRVQIASGEGANPKFVAGSTVFGVGGVIPSAGGAVSGFVVGTGDVRC